MPAMPKLTVLALLGRSDPQHIHAAMRMLPALQQAALDLSCCAAGGQSHLRTRMKQQSLQCKAVTELTMCGGSCIQSTGGTLPMQVGSYICCLYGLALA